MAFDIKDIASGHLLSPQEVTETEDALSGITREKLKAMVGIDPHVDESYRKKILSFLDGPDPVGHLAAGLAGTALTYTISRFFDLKPETQLLLSLAGFGAGVMIASSIGHPQKLHQEHGTTTYLGKGT